MVIACPTEIDVKGCRITGASGILLAITMIAFMQRYMDRLCLILVASLAAASLSCTATWEEYRGSRGAGKADEKVAIFKAHLDDTHRIVSASDERIEYQYDPAQKRTGWFDTHPLIRLLPGQYTITAKTWPFNSLNEFDVNLEAGHKYKVETSLCSFECVSAGKPYRHDRWIQDIKTGQRISDVVSECYLGKKNKRRKVPCPDDEGYRENLGTGKTSAEEPRDEEGHLDSSSEGKANGAVAIDKEGHREIRGADKASEKAVLDEEATHDSRSAGKASAVVAKDEDGYRQAHGADKADTDVAIFKTRLDDTRQIVSASDERIDYQYNPELKRTQRSSPHSLIRLLPGQYTITAKTWPFGSLYEFEVDLKAGHIYEIETSLCSLKCISAGKPYRHDRWIQDITTGQRISGVVSECYLGKKRRRERLRVPCPDDQ